MVSLTADRMLFDATHSAAGLKPAVFYQYLGQHLTVHGSAVSYDDSGLTHWWMFAIFS
jgi:hypothetical protein